MAKSEYTKTDVRSDFKYARLLMANINTMMKQGITDYSNDADASQMAMELIAAVSTFEAYILEKREKSNA
jgi:hypothetical protein